jgi:hypothetical protein
MRRAGPAEVWTWAKKLAAVPELVPDYEQVGSLRVRMRLAEDLLASEVFVSNGDILYVDAGGVLHGNFFCGRLRADLFRHVLAETKHQRIRALVPSYADTVARWIEHKLGFRRLSDSVTQVQWHGGTWDVAELEYTKE